MSNESRRLANNLARKRLEAERQQAAAEQARKAMLTGEMSAAKRERELEQAKIQVSRQRLRTLPGGALWLAISLVGIVALQGLFLWRAMRRPAAPSPQAQPIVADALGDRQAVETQVHFLLAAWNDSPEGLAPYWSPALPPWLRAAGEARLAAAPRPLAVTVEEILVDPRTAMRLAQCRSHDGTPLTFRLSGDPEKPALLGVE
jgi:hypothetical protein